MTQPVWRSIVSEKQIPEIPGTLWTPVLDSLTPGKLMKIEVTVNFAATPPVTGAWTPMGYAAPCTADGDFRGAARGALAQQGTPLIPSAPVGALIARIGGSTADLTLDPGSASVSATRIGFAVGRMCVFGVPQSPVGTLFLGVNDDPTRMAGLTGTLLVNVYEAQ